MAETLVDRGDSVAFRVEAFGRRAATLWIRAPGEAWRPRGVRLDSLGRATVLTGPLQSDLFARVTSGSRASDTVFVKVRLPVFLGALTVTAHYPRYLGLEAEPVPTSGDTLLLPAGTRLETRGEATAPLARAAWKSDTRDEAARRPGERFLRQLRAHDFGRVPRSSWRPRAAHRWRATPSACRSGSCATAPRTVEVPVPGADTLAPLSLQVPLVIDARDDHGITAVTVESRRISRLGMVDSARRETVPVPAERPDRAILTFTLDLNRRGLLPGDTVRYFAIATDNTPRRQAGRSREYVLRLPTMSEVRAAQRPATEDVAGRLDIAAARAGGWSARPTIWRGSGRGTKATGQEDGESLSFEEAKRAEGVAKSQEELIRQAEALKQSLEALRRSAEAAGVADTAWQRQLQEIREQLERALSPELRERLAELQQALKDLDAERPRMRSSDWPRRSRSCARRWSGAASCSAVPRSKAISPTSPRNPGSSPASSSSGTSKCRSRQRQRRHGGATSSPSAPTPWPPRCRRWPRRWKRSRPSNDSKRPRGRRDKQPSR